MHQKVSYTSVKIQLIRTNAGRILDIGCGEGATLNLFSFSKWECVGVDISVKKLKLASKRGMVVVSSGEALPFRDQSFEIIIMEGLLHHVEKPQLILLESYRTLRDRGFFLLSEVVEDCPLIHIIRNIHPYYEGMEVKTRFYSQELLSLMKTLNFKIVDLGVKRGLFSSIISIIIQLLLLLTWQFKKRSISYFSQQVLEFLNPVRKKYADIYIRKYPSRFVYSIYLLLEKNIHNYENEDKK
jgi:ubiquinone/menaquinone biosynthesis C-methylase UbiE